MEAVSRALVTPGPAERPEFLLPERVYIKDAVMMKREPEEMLVVLLETGMEESVEVKKEAEEDGVSVEAARAGLYTGHEVRDQLVLGPVCLERTTPRVLVKAEAKYLREQRAERAKQEPSSETAGSCESEQQLQGRERSRRRGGGGGGGGLRGGGKTGRSKKKKAYSKAQLSEALTHIQHGMSLYAASKQYHIPHTTLRDKRDGKAKGDTCGAPTVLNSKEETSLVDWIHWLGKSGFEVTKKTILQEVANLVRNLNRPNRFKNDVPGKGWYQNFLKRHPIVSEYVARNRSEVYGATVRAWFRRLEDLLTASDLMHMFNDPRRIFNCDEVALFLRPKKKALVRKGANTAFNHIEGDKKECLSVLVNVSADGNMAPPMIVFPYTSVPEELVSSTPEGWACCGATTEALHEYITACFHPWLVTKQIPLPVVLFLDHTVHISIALSLFCSEKAIVLMALLPDSTHITRPMDAGVFRTIEEAWPGIVRGFIGQKKSASLKRTDFAAALKTCFECLVPETIQMGFRCCGLYSLEPGVNHSALQVEDEKVPSSTDEDLKNGFETVTLVSPAITSEPNDEMTDDQLTEGSQHSVSISTQETPLETLRLCRETLHVPEMVANRNRGHCRVCMRRDVMKKLVLKCSPCEVSLCPGGCWRQWHSVERLPGGHVRARADTCGLVRANTG